MSLGAKKNVPKSGLKGKEKERRGEERGWPTSEESSFGRVKNKVFLLLASFCKKGTLIQLIISNTD